MINRIIFHYHIWNTLQLTLRIFDVKNVDQKIVHNSHYILLEESISEPTKRLWIMLHGQIEKQSRLFPMQKNLDNSIYMYTLIVLCRVSNGQKSDSLFLISSVWYAVPLDMSSTPCKLLKICHPLCFMMVHKSLSDVHAVS